MILFTFKLIYYYKRYMRYLYSILYSINRPSLLLSYWHNPKSTVVGAVAWVMSTSFLLHQKHTVATCSETSFLILSVCGLKKSRLVPSSIVLTSLWLRRWWVYNTYRLVTVTGYLRVGVEHRVHIFTRDETGSVYLPTQLERTLQLYW